MVRYLQNLINDRFGFTSIEYALIAALMAVAAIAAICLVKIGKLAHDIALENARCLRKSCFIPSHAQPRAGALSMTLSQ